MQNVQETKKLATETQNTDAVHVWLVLWKAYRAVFEAASGSIKHLCLGDSDFRVLEVLLHTSVATVVGVGLAFLLHYLDDRIQSDEDAARTLELWWLASSEPAGGPAPRGSFLVRDQGRPFQPDRTKDTDYEDPLVRKRGRGFGLDIIYKAMSGVAYHPETKMGNITVLDWDPSKLEQPDEARHAR